MIENCRVCCETTQGTNAKNLFESKHSILLHHIELLTGEWLTNEKNAPTYICNRCEQDLRVAAALRERCIKTQQMLRNKNICTSPTLETIHEIKLEGNLVDEKEHSGNDQRVDASANSALDCTGDEQVDNIKDSVNDDEDFHEENVIQYTNIKEEEFQSIEDETELETQCVTKKCKGSSTKQPMDKPDRTNSEPPVKQRNLNHRRVSSENVMGRNYICDQCGRHFTDPSNLKLHLIRHSGIKNYECEVCNTKFYTAYLLKRHSLMHTNTPPSIACQFCDKKFIYNNFRLRHERTHVKERRFHCQYCDKSFFSKVQQKDHELVHTRIRKYYCELCDTYFLRKTHLTTHYRSKTHKNNEQQNK